MPRGRPKGSKNKPKNIEPKVEPIILSSGNIKDLKRQIRELKKLKLQMRGGSAERIKAHRQIKELKKQLEILNQNRENQAEQGNIDLTPKKSESILTEQEKQEKHIDDNGCIYFNLCKKIMTTQGQNKTCFNPGYFLGKLNRGCKQVNCSKE
jgi:hypothetical protein